MDDFSFLTEHAGRSCTNEVGKAARRKIPSSLFYRVFQPTNRNTTLRPYQNKAQTNHSDSKGIQSAESAPLRAGCWL